MEFITANQTAENIEHKKAKKWLALKVVAEYCAPSANNGFKQLRSFSFPEITIHKETLSWQKILSFAWIRNCVKAAKR